MVQPLSAVAPFVPRLDLLKGMHSIGDIGEVFFTVNRRIRRTHAFHMLPARSCLEELRSKPRLEWYTRTVDDAPSIEQLFVAYRQFVRNMHHTHLETRIVAQLATGVARDEVGG